MITLFSDKFNQLEIDLFKSTVVGYSLKHLGHQIQSLYTNYINLLDVDNLTCPSCNDKVGFIVHAYYQRNIITDLGRVKITIQRIQCKSCAKTHALIPAFLIPYSLVNTHDIISILFDETNNPEISLQLYDYIKDKFSDLDLNVYQNDINSSTYSCLIKLLIHKISLIRNLNIKVINHIAFVQALFLFNYNSVDH